jgi:phospholipid/cholesterol/gamma-HCH transport system substrate-binding protein
MSGGTSDTGGHAMNRKRGALVGAFVIGGLILFVGGLFLIGDRRLLFARQFELNTAFGKVTGLRVGTPVRLAGLEAGEVLEIVLPARPSEKFGVRMRLREDVRSLVRTDSVAGVQTDGIVGGAFIQIGLGTDAAPMVAPGATIIGNDPIEFADLIQEGRDTFRLLSREVTDVTAQVSGALVVLTETVTTANGVIAEVGGSAGKLAATGVEAMEQMRGTVAEARVIVTNLKEGQGTIGQLLTDRALYDRLSGVGREAELTVRNLRETTDRARAAVEGFVSPTGTAQQISQTLRNTLASVQEVTSDMAESTEALKRNFLFRGFFRDRGFFDLDSVSREAYQSGALEGSERTALRIWVDAEVLFDLGPDSVERLTAAGRRRLDSIMADFVRYPRDSPLVVEGYADGGDAPYLVSESRSQLVRDYLLGRFQRQATLTGVMPLSDQAEGSPRGDNRWSGIALTLFVRNDSLAAGSAAP